ncbi:putative Lactate-responsive regulator, IclR family [Caballeronia sordidicola]|uniref:Putative Lactate-responsive regulator, IclR family n=1 Tax=Caballeronia sordidicola TaxID=196367 RepID=A0A242NBA0_CABSO|nr:putative Lactate-responsive regulator, IclR family [Caballeronia sordidicola]
MAPQPERDCVRPPFALFTIRDTITIPLFDVSTDFLHERYEPGIQNVHSGDRAHDAPARCACRAHRSRQSQRTLAEHVAASFDRAPHPERHGDLPAG